MNQGQARGDFGALLGMLRRRAVLIILVPVIVLGVAYAIAKHEQRQYTGTAVLSFKPLMLDIQVTGLPLQVANSDPSTEAATDIGLVTLPQVRDAAARMLGHGYTADYLKKHLNVSQQGKAELINVAATAPSPAAAAAIANAVATSFIAYDRQTIVASLDSGISKLNQQLKAPGQTALQTSILRNSLTKLTELTAVQPDNVQLSALALPPTSASSPKTALDLVIGGIAGLLLGLGLAVLAEQFDARVRRPEEVEDALNLPVLAMIPRSRVLKKGENLSEADVEAFRMLRTNLRYHSQGRGDARSVLLTSAGAEAGKTTVSLHLAAAAAAVMGGRVLLIEADLRRPRLAELLGLPSDHGLSTALAFGDSLAEAVVTVHAAPGNGQNGNNGSTPDGSFPESFDALVAGPPTPHASELLSSREMSELLRAASETYDLTIVDGPPPGLVSDVIPLIKQVDAVVLVARLGREYGPELKKLQAQLRGLGVVPVGVVANFSRRAVNPYTATARR